MNKTLLVTLLLGAAAITGVLYTAQSGSSTSSFLRSGYQFENEFKQFSTKYGKQYAHDEGFYRYRKFAANMEIINAHNALFNAGQSTYFLGVNQLADMDTAELKQKYMGLLQKQTFKKTVGASAINVSVPASVDWTTQGAVTEVKNQGQCGSCWSFSASGALEGLNFLKNGNLLSFSEQALVDCSGSYGNQGCNGGYMDYAFKYTAANGIPTESDYPYTAADGTCQSYTSAFKNSGYQDVTANSESALIAALAQQPVSVGIEADQSAFQLYAGGVLNDSSCGTTIDHGVLAVGYDASSIKIKNSWGSSWGESGYIRFARIGDGPGQCGVYQMASYPTA